MGVTFKIRCRKGYRSMEPESRKYITPKTLGITKRYIEPPNGGWKERSYYVVEYARTLGCLVKKGIFYTGEIYDNEPMAYNALGVFTYKIILLVFKSYIIVKH